MALHLASPWALGCGALDDLIELAPSTVAAAPKSGNASCQAHAHEVTALTATWAGDIESARRRRTASDPRWDVPLRDASGAMYGRTFTTRREAEIWKREQLASRDQGSWTDPQARRQTVEEWINRAPPLRSDAHDLPRRRPSAPARSQPMRRGQTPQDPKAATTAPRTSPDRRPGRAPEARGRRQPDRGGETRVRRARPTENPGSSCRI